MNEISREEFNTTMTNVFKKMDSHQKAVNDSILTLTVAVTEVKTKLNDLDIPKLPDRPCDQLNQHLTDHKQSVESWKKPIIVGLIVTAFLFIQQPIKELISKLLR